MNSGFQKVTRNGKLVTTKETGLPVFNRSVDYRIKQIRNMITIGMNDSDAKWWEINYDTRRKIGFNT